MFVITKYLHVNVLDLKYILAFFTFMIKMCARTFCMYRLTCVFAV